MARSSRKRRKPRPRPAAPAPAASEPEPQPAKRASQRKSRLDDAPAAPWGSFPLVELMVLTALVLLVAGFLIRGYQGTVMIGGGLALGSLAGLELSVREHLAGYRSHTMLLAGTAGVLTIAALFVLAQSLAPGMRVGAGIAVFALASVGLRALFRRRSGGASFRVGGYRG
ncbi:MAG: hypothetical protein QOJ38_1138 [Solirubrobacterales bacterium]|jgi:hypothetical protein|nr:hypothetical protein [Solirubrobacterales bacterium]